MIPALLLYGTAIALLLALGGVLLEGILARQGWPRRGVWAATLLCSIAIPVGLTLVPPAPAPSVPALTLRVPALPFHDGWTEPMATVVQPVRSAAVAISSSAVTVPSVDRLFGAAWVAMSAGLLAAWALSWRRLRRECRAWQRATIENLEVWITPATGPAVLGFLRPQVLLPQCMLAAPAGMRSVVLAHEREHIVARDPLLLFAATVLLLFAPWNLPLWWQLRRLRFAIEVDCDARVLRAGTPASRYGEVLLAVSQRQPLAPLGAMAIARPRSQLERRVRLMVSPASRPAQWLVGLAATLGAACVVLALGLPAPALRDSVLRTPRLHDWSPYLPTAEAAVRAAYPELFAGHFDGTVALGVDMKRDGSIFALHRRDFPAGPLPRDVRFDDVSFDDFIADWDMGDGASGRKFLGWFGPDHANGLYLDYAVLKWPHDPTRSASRVKAAVAGRYPEYLQAYPPGDAAKEQRTKLLTVLMNDDGTIDRESFGELTDGVLPDDWKAYDRFLAMGLRPDQFGHRGRTSNHVAADGSHDPNAPRLAILFAWPRRADDPPDVVSQDRSAFRQVFDARSREIDQRVPDEVFIKRYFPDIWEHGPASASETAWILSDTDGAVCDSGRRSDAAFEKIATDLMQRYPGTRIEAYLGIGAQTAVGRTVDLNYLRLQDDSPLTSCQALATERLTP